MRVLLVGETWLTSTTIVNGVDTFPARVTRHDSAVVLASRLEAAGFHVDRMPGERVNDDFPDDEAGLQPYDVIVLGDVGSDSFLLHPGMYATGAPQADRLRTVAGFARTGGGIIMIGGYLSFSGYRGMAGYGRTALAETLPVHLLDGDDRVERPDGVTPRVVLGEHPALDGVAGGWPPLLGYNRVAAREGAEVLVTVAGEPLLVTHDTGAGRCVAFTSDCAPHWATDAFLSWQHYGTLFANLVRWAGRGSGDPVALRERTDLP